jgi:hypothetical protein
MHVLLAFWCNARVGCRGDELGVAIINANAMLRTDRKLYLISRTKPSIADSV